MIIDSGKIINIINYRKLGLKKNNTNTILTKNIEIKYYEFELIKIIKYIFLRSYIDIFNFCSTIFFP